ncbi:cytidylate kinase family protein [Candidatus Woesearchaeota archaeon]|nr:cytidylate kinase family protein [Candidatus Woesearchaeota archaeon]
MIITVSGDAGAGKSTAAGLVAVKLGYRHYSVGDLMREIAGKRRLTLLEVSRLAERDRSIDTELDNMQVKLGKDEDSFVLDSRLGYHFIPNSFKVFLKVGTSEAARRIFGDKRKLERENKTLMDTVKNIRQRKKSEIQRYRKYYSLNPYDAGNYDLVLDTTKLTPEETAMKIIAALPK